MTEPTDPATTVPDAAQLRGESVEDQPDASEVLPSGRALEIDHVVEDDDRG